ncbi:MAG: 50S ribosomal protein L6 [Chromatiales bacterium]|jgi:large subunit ribosomal protein L6|nr:50S ribosomal protein L6 [Chromatiales bacterium]
MSRIANAPVAVPKGVDVTLSGQDVTVKGPKGTLDLHVHRDVSVAREGDELRFAARSGSKPAIAQAGTARALVNNLVVGVSHGFERRLALVGVGYRAQLQGKSLNLSLGFSHPVEYPVPEDIQIETPSQTEIVVRGINKQRVGQVSADIRAYRPPEPYKGKGVRYADEHVVRKEAKKK